jgi:hypothetical protein
MVSSSRPREAINNLFNSLTQSMMDGWQYDGCCNWLVWAWGGGRKEGRKEKEAQKSPIQSNCIRFHQTGFLYWTTGWNQKSRPVHVTERLDNWMKINIAHLSTRDRAFSEDQHLFFNSEILEGWRIRDFLRWVYLLKITLWNNWQCIEKEGMGWARKGGK